MLGLNLRGKGVHRARRPPGTPKNRGPSKEDPSGGIES
jgi:hypothetical protein